MLSQPSITCHPSCAKPASAKKPPPNDTAQTGGNLKLCLLILLVVQASSATLVGRYTRSSVPESELYDIGHLVFVIECAKFVASTAAEWITTSGRLMESMKKHIFKNPREPCRVVVPAFLYVMQNSLTYMALSNLTAPMFLSLQQSKLIATAIFSVTMLNRSYSTKQWVCLLVLGVGVAILALDEISEARERETLMVLGPGIYVHLDMDGAYTGELETLEESAQSFVAGFLALVGACLSSAFAGVYFEKVLAPEKSRGARADLLSSGPSLWIRNMQLAFFSIVFAFLQSIMGSATEVSETRIHNAELGQGVKAANNQPYLHGFTNYVWLLVGLQAGGGLLVSAVMKYADNVLKCLAMGIVVVVASLLSTLMFGVQLSGQFVFGACVILMSVYSFGNEIPLHKANP